MDVVGRVERFLDRAVRVQELRRQVEHADLRVGAEVQFVDLGVGQQDVFVEAALRRVAGQDLRDDEFGVREFLTQIAGARLDALRRGGDAGLGREEHVIVADHQHDGLWLESINAAMVEAPEHVLGLVAADPDVHRLAVGELLRPGSAPLDRDAVADQQHIDRAWIGLDGLHEALMDLQPRVPAEEPSSRDDRPELGEVLVAFTAGAAVELGFSGDVGALFGGQRPTAWLGVRRLTRVFEGGQGCAEQQGGEDGVWGHGLQVRC